MTDTTDQDFAEYLDESRKFALGDLSNALSDVSEQIVEGFVLAVTHMPEEPESWQFLRLKNLADAWETIAMIRRQIANGEVTVQTMPDEQIRELYDMQRRVRPGHAKDRSDA